MTKKDNKTLERIATLCHIQWANWMKYVFSKCDRTPEGTYIIPKWAVDRWNQQINTSYSQLSEEEKDSDRREAEKFIKLIAKQIELHLTF